MSQKNFIRVCRSANARFAISCMMLALCSVALAQQGKTGPAKTDLTGRYDGTAKNKAEDVITVTLDLTDKEGALSGTIHSSHGDFTITGGTHKGDDVTIEFDAGSPGTLSLHTTEDKLVGTWNAGDDGGSLDLKKAAAAPEPGAKGKS